MDTPEKWKRGIEFPVCEQKIANGSPVVNPACVSEPDAPIQKLPSTRDIRSFVSNTTFPFASKI